MAGRAPRAIPDDEVAEQLVRCSEGVEGEQERLDELRVCVGESVGLQLS